MGTNPPLQRQLGLVSATALVVGEVIGVGIFLTPANMARSLGSPFWLLVIWLTMALLSLSGALCYGELAMRFPEAGGGYVYLREGFGRLVAFLYGWKSMLVLDPGLTAAWAVGVATYTSVMVDLPPGGPQGIAIGTILLVAIVNALGVRLGDRVLRLLTAAKLGLLGFIVLWGFGRGLGQWTNFMPFVEQHPGSAPLQKALAGGLMSAFFSLAGWWDMNKAAGEIRDPERTIPRALVLGISIVTATYILVSAAFLYLVPLEQVTSADAFASQVGSALFGTAGSLVFAGIVIVTLLGSLTSYLMAAPRVYFAMARDGLFFPQLAQVHPRLGTPVRAIAVQAAIACVLVASGSFNQIIGYFIFVTVAFLGLTVCALFVLPRPTNSPTTNARFGYPVTAILFLLLVIVLLTLMAMTNPYEATIGLGVVLLGVPVYLLFFRK